MRQLDITKAMASKHRLEILRLLYTRGPMYVTELGGFIGCNLHSTSHHICILRETGIVSAEYREQMRFYTLSDEVTLQLMSVLFPDELYYKDKIQPIKDEVQKTEVIVKKTRGSIPTVLEVEGYRYILHHKDQYNYKAD